MCICVHLEFWGYLFFSPSGVAKYATDYLTVQDWDQLHDSDSSSLEEKGENAISSPAYQLTRLKRWIEVFFATHSLAADRPLDNALICAVAELARYCVLFGLYRNPVSLARLCTLAVRLLDCVDEGGTISPLDTPEALETKKQCLLLMEYCCNLQLRLRLRATLAHFKERRGSVLLARLQGMVAVEDRVGTIADDLAAIDEIVARTAYLADTPVLRDALLRAAGCPRDTVVLAALQLLERLCCPRAELLAALSKAQVCRHSYHK